MDGTELHFLKRGAATVLGGAALAGAMYLVTCTEHSNTVRKFSRDPHSLFYSDIDGITGFTGASVIEDEHFRPILIDVRRVNIFGSNDTYIDVDLDGRVDVIVSSNIVTGRYADYGRRDAPPEILAAVDKEYQSQLQRFGLTKLLNNHD